MCFIQNLYMLPLGDNDTTNTTKQLDWVITTKALGQIGTNCDS